VEVTVGGSLMAWAVHQEGPAADWLRHDFDVVIEAFSAAARAGVSSPG